MLSSELADKYISDHNNPIVKKIEVFGSKLFLSPLNEEQEQRKERVLAEMKKCLEHERVDRRVARGVAEWIPERNVAKVTKNTGGLASFGVQNKDGKFLNPEEILFLMEMNKLELIYKKVSLSIEEAYKNIQSLEKYLTFKKLTLHNYKLKCGDLSQEKQDVSDLEQGMSKEKLETEEKTSDEPPEKIARLSQSNSEIFKKLKQNGPKPFEPKIDNREIDYRVESGKTESFNLIVETSKEFTGNVDKKNINVFALPPSDNLAFYKFYNVNIPDL